jgi:hypothetical protein
MTKRVKKTQPALYRLEYAEDEGVADAEYDTFPATTDEEAKTAAQQATNRVQVPLQLFQRIEGMNFHIARLEPIYEDG